MKIKQKDQYIALLFVKHNMHGVFVCSEHKNKTEDNDIKNFTISVWKVAKLE